MSASTFKKLLLLRAESEELKKAIEQIPDGVFGGAILESLEKADNKRGASDLPPLMDEFSNEIADNPDILNAFVHGIGHHLSHSAAAHREGYRSLGDRHLRAAMEHMNILDSAAKHSKGKISTKHGADLRHWEENLGRKGTPGKFREVHHTPSERRQIFGIDASGPRAVVDKRSDFIPENISHTDLSWARSKPSFHSNVSAHVDKPFPFEEYTVNGQHIPIEHDIASPRKFVSHPVDYHPIRSIHGIPLHKIGPEMHDFYMNKLESFYDKHLPKHFERKAAFEAKHGTEGPPRKQLFDRATDYVHPAEAAEQQRTIDAKKKETAGKRAFKNDVFDRNDPSYKYVAPKQTEGLKSDDDYANHYTNLIHSFAHKNWLHQNEPHDKEAINHEEKLIRTIQKDLLGPHQKNNLRDRDFVNRMESHPSVQKARLVHREMVGNSPVPGAVSHLVPPKKISMKSVSASKSPKSPSKASALVKQKLSGVPNEQ